MILTIARREWRAGLLSPLSWGLLAAHQVVLAWVFLRVLERFAGLEEAKRAAGLTLELTLNLFGFAAVLALLIVPLAAMRMLSGELRDGTDRLLGAAPISIGQVVFGKLLALAGTVTVITLLPLAMALVLAIGVPLDLGLLAAASLGVWLSAMAFAAIGLYASSLTSQPGMAAIAAYGILILLSVIGRTEGVAEVAGLFDWLTWNEHLFWLLLGVVRVSDLLYFGLLIAFFVALTHRRLCNRRLG